MSQDPKEYYHNKGQQVAGDRDYEPPHGVVDDLTTWSSEGMRTNTEENKSYDDGYFSSRGQSDGAANSYKPPSDSDAKEAYDEAWRASYDETHKSGCFLTEACCALTGLPDDCHELVVLRRFRDGHLLRSNQGRELVRQYYDVAPSLVDRVRRSRNSADHWSFVFDQVTRVVALIEEGRSEEVISAYREMVDSLSERLSQETAA